MLIQILKGTPPWVFALFLGLLVLGGVQARDRSLTLARVLAVPVALVAFSLYGVVSAFGAQAAALTAWAAGLAVSVLLARRLAGPSAARWEPATQTWFVPGSWIPLALMMFVFFARYAIAVSLALNRGLAQDPLFALAASLAYGLLSGAFVARALGIVASRPGHPAHSVQSS